MTHPDIDKIRADCPVPLLLAYLEGSPDWTWDAGYVGVSIAMMWSFDFAVGGHVSCMFAKVWFALPGGYQAFRFNQEAEAIAFARAFGQWVEQLKI